jgi:glycosyltransferase involved in cell wall biosynthesis
MIKVAALTSGRHVPSARFRIRQHITRLRAHGLDIREYVPFINKYEPIPERLAALGPHLGVPSLLIEVAWRSAKRISRVPGITGSWSHAVTWLERLLFPGRFTAESWLKRPLVFDVDDAIWLHPPGGEAAARKTAEMATVVIAGNQYIADWFSAFSREVRVLPTAVDTARFRPRSAGKASRDTHFVIGWSGTSSGLTYLEAIEVPLRRFLDDHRNALLLVMSDRAPRFSRLDPARVRYESWSEAKETHVLARMDVGLMPLPDNDWTRGKCAFKMLLYMACGVPVIASPVGMNKEILAKSCGLACRRDEEWYDALASLHADRARAMHLGRLGRMLVEREFSTPSIGDRLARLIRDVA